MIRQSIARRYAKGLFAVAEKDGNYERYGREVADVLSLASSDPKITSALMLPLIEMDRRKELLSDIAALLSISEPVRAVLSLLMEKHRMRYLPLIYDAYKEMVDEKEGRARGVATSAFPVSSEERKRIEEALTERLGKKVSLSFEEDRDLIGGIRVVVGGLRIDGSVRRQLELLNERMMKE